MEDNCDESANFIPSILKNISVVFSDVPQAHIST